jgi:hypothetical protein
LIQAYAGSAILLDDLNARVVLGQEIDVGTHAQITSALVRIASRLGLQRRGRSHYRSGRSLFGVLPEIQRKH